MTILLTCYKIIYCIIIDKCAYSITYLYYHVLCKKARVIRWITKSGARDLK
ncbi:protein of unknown function [Ruminococcaceae bacterium BL-4]|nr:protein of unknown function [Ruminococcaceae bacterium BL-4]